MADRRVTIRRKISKADCRMARVFSAAIIEDRLRSDDFWQADDVMKIAGREEYQPVDFPAAS